MHSRFSDLVVCRRLLQDARPYWPQLACIFGLSLLAVPVAMLLPVPLKLVVDSVLGDHAVPGFLNPVLSRDASTSAVLAVAVILLVAVTLLHHLEGYASWLLQVYTGEQLVLSFRARLFRHAQQLSLTYHDRVGTADALYRIHYDVAAAQYVPVSGLIPLLTATCTLFALFAVTAWIDWQLALIALMVVPVLVLLTEVYRRRVRTAWIEVKELDSFALSVLQEVLGALRVVKAFGQEDRERNRYAEHSSRAVRKQLRVIMAEAAFGLFVTLVLAVGTSLVLMVGVWHVQSGLITLGELLLVMAYLAQLYKPLEVISKKVTGLQGSLASAERAFALLDQPADVKDRPSAKTLARAAGAVDFRNVTFGYDKDRPVLREVSITVPVGARVGIAGRTGAGKTTLISLLLRFHDPSVGAVFLDGVDLRDYRLRDLRNQYALVLQEPVLFSTSVAENIAYGRPEASAEEIKRAAQAANVHDFIASLPEGYGTRVGERGMTLSGGERQRISLARAFLKDAPILILDEPTSSVDTKSEAAILDALNRLMRGRTTFIIAHRLNTLATCDLRLEVDEGRVVSHSHPESSQSSKGNVFRPPSQLEAFEEQS
jgi:ATP-binding cassette, subfamily B, bacterial